MSAGRTNIVLIGMPGSGKSTVGVLLAKFLGLGFVDTDVLIQAAEGRTLQQILDRDGYLALRAVEERVLRALDVQAHVVATGGSAVYSAPAMSHLRSSGIAVFLDVTLGQVRQRVRNASSRGIAAAPGTTLDSLYAQRRPLYQQYADVTVTCGAMDLEEVAQAVVLEMAKAGMR
jgi:shikimate kinase